MNDTDELNEALAEIRYNATHFNSEMPVEGFEAALADWLVEHDARIAAAAWDDGYECAEYDSLYDGGFVPKNGRGNPHETKDKS